MTNSALLQIDKDEARVGMFIHGFGNQWLRSPFATSQFKLSSSAELQALRESSVTTLIIDLTKGIGPPVRPLCSRNSMRAQHPPTSERR
jgi:hypothetical protein